MRSVSRSETAFSQFDFPVWFDWVPVVKPKFRQLLELNDIERSDLFNARKQPGFNRKAEYGDDDVGSPLIKLYPVDYNDQRIEILTERTQVLVSRNDLEIVDRFKREFF
jgi:hypothetical protein